MSIPSSSTLDTVTLTPALPHPSIHPHPLPPHPLPSVYQIPSPKRFQRTDELTEVVITVLFIILLADFIRRYRAGKPAQRQFHPLPNRSFMRRDARADSMQIGSSGSSAAEGSQGYMMHGVGSSPRKTENGLNGSHGFTGAGMGVGGEMISRKNVWIVVGMLLYTTLLIVIR